MFPFTRVPFWGYPIFDPRPLQHLKVEVPQEAPGPNAQRRGPGCDCDMELERPKPLRVDLPREKGRDVRLGSICGLSASLKNGRFFCLAPGRH